MKKEEEFSGDKPEENPQKKNHFQTGGFNAFPFRR